MTPDFGLCDIQQQVIANRDAKGFTRGNVLLDLALMQREVSEFFTAWRRGEDVAPELADVLIFLVGIADACGVDMATAVRDKLRVNAARIYRPGANGVLEKVSGAGGAG